MRYVSLTIYVTRPPDWPALWLAGESSTSQRCGEWLPVYRRSVHHTPGPNVKPNMALKHPPLIVVSFLVRLVNVIFRLQYFPPAWKYGRVTSTLKPWKDPELTSFQTRLLDTIGKLFDKILLTRILSEVSGRGFLRNEQLGFGSKHSTALQLASLVERVHGNLEEKRLTGTIFLDVAKVFDTVWVDGLLHKLTFLKLLPYLWKPSLPSCTVGRSQCPLNIHNYLSLHASWRGSGWNNLSCPIQSICQRHSYAYPSFYTDDTAILATSR